VGNWGAHLFLYCARWGPKRCIYWGVPQCSVPKQIDDAPIHFMASFEKEKKL